jgi:hypothetical protein
MKSTPFDPKKDYPPIPFDLKVCETAKKLKESGLEWTPHVGCFVWDEKNLIAVPSPFPNNIYFILNLNHFLKIFGQIDLMKEKLVWLPTEYQVYHVVSKLGAEKEFMKQLSEISDPLKRLIVIYNNLIQHLSKKK